MKRLVLVILAAVWAGAVVRAESELPLDGVAAYVNGSVITVGEVRDAMAPLVPDLREVYEGAELVAKLREAYGSVLTNMIDSKLIVEAYEADTKIDKEAAEKHVERRMADFIQSRYKGDRQAFLKDLKEERLTYDEWRRRMRERVVVGMMRQKEVDSQVVVGPREVQQAYNTNEANYRVAERVRVRAIVIHGGADSAERAVKRKLADDVLAKLKAGDAFESAAKRVSEDGKAASGGDWGWMDASDLRRELADALKTVTPGGMTGIIEADEDFYILKLEERNPAGVIPFEEVRATIEKDLRVKESRRLYKVWIERLRRDAYIETDMKRAL